ncbi:MAG TPA: rRNA maturation RNase YbeY [Candidatus Binatia bacterium]|nr:rRNA maturation RNase YbeY [Candidatus Binatia bacterium]
MILKKKVAGLNASSLERLVLRARKAAGLPRPVNILITGNPELRRLNRQFRGKDAATDVLSFPAAYDSRSAGDVAISADIARANARALGHSAAQEVKILALHGILHLAGYDHESDRGEMARKEGRLRRELKLESGLIERSQSLPGKSGKSSRRIARGGRKTA